MYESNSAHLPASMIIESIIIGFKKQSVYDMKIINKKGLAAALDSSEIRNSRDEAAKQMLKRYDRDIKTIMESLQSERNRDTKLLAEKGAPRSKLLEAEQRRDLYDLDQIRKEQGKLLFCLAGLTVDIKLLQNISYNTEAATPMLSITQRDSSVWHMSEDGFDENGVYDQINTFVPDILAWKQWMVRIEDIYSRSLPCLYSLFYTAHIKVIIRAFVIKKTLYSTYNLLYSLLMLAFL
jgi:hypothetical protein